MKKREFDYSHYPEWRDPNELTPYSKNAKIHDEKQVRNIANSIRRFGWQQEAVVTSDGVLVIGHGRRLAAIKLGCKIPVKVIDQKAEELTDDDIKELRIADNLTNESPWDLDMLNEELAGLEMDGFEFDLDIPDEEEPEQEIAEDYYDKPAPEIPDSQSGDIYILGDHRLLCGDSTNPEDVEKLLDGAEIDLLLTDPPYNVNLGQNERVGSNKNNKKILNDNMTEATFIEFLTSALQNACQSMKPGAAYYIFYAGLHHIEFESAVRNIPDFKLHEQLVWVKSSFVLGRNSDYQWQHEPILYGWKAGAAHYFTDSRAEGTTLEEPNAKLSTLKKEQLIQLCERLMGVTQSTTVQRADKPNTADLHPTVKPQALIGPLIRNSSKPGWKVLDLFGGSGSTLIAYEQTRRKCYMMELDPKYADVIVDRWQEFTGKPAIRIRNGKKTEIKPNEGRNTLLDQ